MTALTATEIDAVANLLVDAGAVVIGPLRAHVIAGGRSNLTFRLDDGLSRWVLRTPPRTGRTPSAHDVAREYRVTSALAGAGVPVPAPVLLCEDESILGGSFAIADFVDGTSIQSADQLGDLDDHAVDDVVSHLVETLAALHAVDYVRVGLERFGRPERYAERQLRRWAGQWKLVADPRLIALGDEIVAILAAQMPGQRRVAVLHGDYRADNTLVDLADRARVRAVVDWELSTVGDPAADVAMMCAYRHPAFDLIVGAPSAWTSDRLPDVAGLAGRYEHAGGAPLEAWEFHLALAYFKVAAIAAGIDYRFRAGSGTGIGFDSAGESVEAFLEASREALPTGRSRGPSRPRHPPLRAQGEDGP